MQPSILLYKAWLINLPCSLLVFLKYTIKSASAKRDKVIWIILRGKKKEILLHILGSPEYLEMPGSLSANVTMISLFQKEIKLVKCRQI